MRLVVRHWHRHSLLICRSSGTKWSGYRKLAAHYCLIGFVTLLMQPHDDRLDFRHGLLREMHEVRL